MSRELKVGDRVRFLNDDPVQGEYWKGDTGTITDTAGTLYDFHITLDSGRIRQQSVNTCANREELELLVEPPEHTITITVSPAEVNLLRDLVARLNHQCNH